MAHRTINWITRFLSHLSSKIAPIKSGNPSAALESLERWSAFATVAIFIGIAFEAWTTIHFQKSDETNLEVAAKLFADFCIGSGLLVEVVCILRTIVESRREKAESDSKVAEAYERVAQLEFESGYTQERIAMATERAAKTELETQRLKTEFAWRQLPEEQEMLLRHELRELRGASVMIWHFINDPESQNFAEDIAAIFRLAGWQTSMHPAMFEGNFAFEIRVPLAAGEDGGAASTIKKAFTNAGIDFLPLNIPEVLYGTAPLPDAPLGPLTARLYVGPKPKPFSAP